MSPLVRVRGRVRVKECHELHGKLFTAAVLKQTKTLRVLEGAFAIEDFLDVVDCRASGCQSVVAGTHVQDEGFNHRVLGKKVRVGVHDWNHITIPNNEPVTTVTR